MKKFVVALLISLIAFGVTPVNAKENVPTFTEEEVNNMDVADLPSEFNVIIGNNESRTPTYVENWTTNYINKLLSTDEYICNHPDFNKYDKVDGYYFGSGSSYTVTGTITYKNFTATIEYQKSNSYGKFISADSNRWSIPAIYGDTYESSYTVKRYSPTGIYIDSRTEKRYEFENTYIKAEYAK